MTNNLLIVESPGKIPIIRKILGKQFIIKACKGHIKDLDKKSLSIDVEDNFRPTYVIPYNKRKTISELKNISKNVEMVYVASDDDREGEMIALSLIEELKLKNYKRVVFNEITNTVILESINNPRDINYNIIDAQKARRVIDKLIGYKLSPLLWTNNKKSKLCDSIGRVQSVILKIIIDKELEIKNFIKKKIYEIKCLFTINNNEFESSITNIGLESEDDIKIFLNNFNKETQYKIFSKNEKITKVNPLYPFTTASMQYTCYKTFGYNIAKTMSSLQKLYEKGYITYIRTNSYKISNTIIDEISKYITNTYSLDYLDNKNYTTTNSDAHECIRPTNIYLEFIEDCKKGITLEEKKIYNLIWKRTIQSQMKEAEIKNIILQVEVLNNEKKLYIDLKLTQEIFNGFKIIDNNKSTNIFKIDINSSVGINNIIINENYSTPSIQYDEGSLIKYIELNNIGRPSTYHGILFKLLKKKYITHTNIKSDSFDLKYYELNNKCYTKKSEVVIYKNVFVSTENGNKINNFVSNNFSNIININFSSQIENDFDLIAKGQIKWYDVVKLIYDMFNKIINKIITENNDDLLGTIEGINIYCGMGKYGKYVKSYINDKWKYKSIKNIKNIDVNLAYQLLF